MSTSSAIEDDYTFFSNKKSLSSGVMVFEKKNRRQGRVVFSLDELPHNVSYVTEKGSVLMRVSDTAVTLSGKKTFLSNAIRTLAETQALDKAAAKKAAKLQQRSSSVISADDINGDNQSNGHVDKKRSMTNADDAKIAEVENKKDMFKLRSKSAVLLSRFRRKTDDESHQTDNSASNDNNNNNQNNNTNDSNNRKSSNSNNHNHNNGSNNNNSGESRTAKLKKLNPFARKDKSENSNNNNNDDNNSNNSNNSNGDNNEKKKTRSSKTVLSDSEKSIAAHMGNSVAKNAQNEKVQEKTGAFVSKAAKDDKIQKNVANVIASSSDSRVVQALAKNDRVQKAVGSAVSKAASNKTIQQQVAKKVTKLATDPETQQKPFSAAKKSLL